MNRPHTPAESRAALIFAFAFAVALGAILALLTADWTWVPR